MPSVRLVRDPIDPSDVLDRVGDAAHGATVLFLGIVRDHNDGRAVRGIRYEAYAEMVESVLAEIADEALTRIADADEAGGRVAIVHRAGDLAIGETSVAIAVSSAHRAEAYDASRYVMEQIKRRVPIWKREEYADGAEDWVDGHSPGPRSTAVGEAVDE